MAQRELKVRITADTKSLNKGIKESKSRVSSLAETAKKAGLALAAAFAARQVVRGLKDIVQAASDAQETFSKFSIVYADVASSAEESFKKLRSEYGLSSKAAKELLSDTGDLLTGFGFAGAEALRLSEEVNKLAVDLASFTNFAGGAKGASEALTKALLGERESVKALGISILEQDVQAQMLVNTKKGLIFETERQAKAQATLDIAMAQSKNAIGDYERTSDSFANQSRLLNERLNDLSVTLGEFLLPATTKGTSALITYTNRAKDLLEDVMTKGNMSKLEKWARILAGGAVGIVTGGQAGQGISEPVWLDAMAARAADASESISEIRANLESITDEEQMRVKLQEQIFSAQQHALSYQKRLQEELGKERKEQNQDVIAALEAEFAKSTDIYKNLQSNFETYIQSAITKREEESAKAAELAERERREREEDENNRRAAIGEIGRLEEDLKKAQLKYTEANTEQARVQAEIVIRGLERELELLESIAQERADMQMFGPKPDMTPMVSKGPLAIPGIGDNTTQGIIDADRAARGLNDTITTVSDSMIKWEEIATGAASSVGMGLMQMAMDGNKSASELIKSLLAQVTAQLIAKFMSIPMPGSPWTNIALAAGAGSIAGALFSKIPAFAEGGKVSSPTLAMFGEYPGARTNPEYALRQDQLIGLMGKQQGTLTHRISGQDLLIVLNEAERQRNNSF